MKPFIIIGIIILLFSCHFINGDTKTQTHLVIDSTQYTFTFIDSTWLFKGKPFKMNEPIGYYSHQQHTKHNRRVKQNRQQIASKPNNG